MLHPNDAGDELMANAIDLTLFDPASESHATAGGAAPRTAGGAPDLGGVCWSTPVTKETTE